MAGMTQTGDGGDDNFAREEGRKDQIIIKIGLRHQASNGKIPF